MEGTAVRLVERQAGKPVDSTGIGLLAPRSDDIVDDIGFSLVERQAGDPVDGTALRLVAR